MADIISVVIEGRKIITESVKIIKTMDTCADACTVIMPWSPGKDSKLDKVTAPFSYSNCSIYINDELLADMVLYDSTHTTSNSGTVKELQMYSKTADIIDSTVSPPYEANNITLTDRCKQQCKPFGINVIVGDDVAALINQTRRIVTVTGWKRLKVENLKGPLKFNDYYYFYQPTGTKSKIIVDEKKFPRVIADPKDTIFEHIRKLASERKCLISCTKNGDILITRANVDGKSVGTISELAPKESAEFSIKFSGRKRFNIYKAIATSCSSKKPVKPGSAIDNTVKAPRRKTFDAGSDVPGNAKNSAEWERNKAAANTLEIDFPVESFRAPDGSIWQPNTQVTVISPTMNIKNGFTFLITQVEYNYNGSGGTASLQLKPPSLYTGKDIIEPWLWQSDDKFEDQTTTQTGLET